jgi:hypothetical protein
MTDTPTNSNCLSHQDGACARKRHVGEKNANFSEIYSCCRFSRDLSRVRAADQQCDKLVRSPTSH